MAGPALFLLALLSSGPFEVVFAPDHPAPIFYTDDPLIVSVTSLESYTGAAEIYAELPTGRTHRSAVSSLRMNAGHARWIVVDDLPLERGPHRFSITFDGDAPVAVGEVTRVDRPADDRVLSVGAVVRDWSVATRHLLSSLPLAALRFDASMPELPAWLSSLPASFRFRVHVRMEGGQMDGRRVEALLKSLGAHVDVWELAAIDSPAAYNRIAVAIRTFDPAAHIAVEATSVEIVGTLFDERAAHTPDAVIVHTDDVSLAEIRSIRRLLQRAGHERVPLLLEPGMPDGADDLAGRVHRAVAGEATTLFVDQDALFQSGRPGSGYAALAAAGGTARPGLTFLGSVPAGPGELYRLPPTAAARWKLIVAFDGTKALPPALSEIETAVDRYGNEVARTKTGSASRGAVWAVTGSDSQPMMARWIAQVREGAHLASANAELMAELPAETAASLMRLRDFTLDDPLRFELFALVRGLPALEERWHRGLAEAHEVVPAIASLARLARTLGALAEEKGEPFLESLDTTLARVSALSEASSEAHPNPPPHSRLAFLRGEVDRLVAEARSWNAVGRRIEAKSVAVLAEWRARSLGAAAVALPDRRAATLSDKEKV